MYFMQVAGEPLNLRFTKGHYGPYAENLRHVLNEIEGHMVSGYTDGGDELINNWNSFLALLRMQPFS